MLNYSRSLGLKALDRVMILLKCGSGQNLSGSPGSGIAHRTLVDQFDFLPAINRTQSILELDPGGGGPFVLCPELLHENVTTGNTGSILCLSSGYKINSFLAIRILPGFPVVIY